MALKKTSMVRYYFLSIIGYISLFTQSTLSCTMNLIQFFYLSSSILSSTSYGRVIWYVL